MLPQDARGLPSLRSLDAKGRQLIALLDALCQLSSLTALHHWRCYALKRLLGKLGSLAR